jgi:hypothetical protein
MGTGGNGVRGSFGTGWTRSALVRSSGSYFGRYLGRTRTPAHQAVRQEARPSGSPATSGSTTSPKAKDSSSPVASPSSPSAQATSSTRRPRVALARRHPRPLHDPPLDDRRRRGVGRARHRRRVPPQRNLVAASRYEAAQTPELLASADDAVAVAEPMMLPRRVDPSCRCVTAVR